MYNVSNVSAAVRSHQNSGQIQLGGPKPHPEGNWGFFERSRRVGKDAPCWKGNDNYK